MSGTRTVATLPNGDDFGREIHAFRNDDGTYRLRIITNCKEISDDDVVLDIPRALIGITEIFQSTDDSGRDLYYTISSIMETN